MTLFLCWRRTVLESLRDRSQGTNGAKKSSARERTFSLPARVEMRGGFRLATISPLRRFGRESRACANAARPVRSRQFFCRALESIEPSPRGTLGDKTVKPALTGCLLLWAHGLVSHRTLIPWALGHEVGPGFSVCAEPALIRGRQLRGLRGFEGVDARLCGCARGKCGESGRMHFPGGGESLD